MGLGVGLGMGLGVVGLVVGFSVGFVVVSGGGTCVHVLIVSSFISMLL